MAVEAVLIGGGNRGRVTYGGYARLHPGRLRIVALAEPVVERRRAVAEEHGLSGDRVADDWRGILGALLPWRRWPSSPPATRCTWSPRWPPCSAAITCCWRSRWLPIPGDCLRVVEAAEAADRILQIGHVLRYTKFYERVHEIAASGRLGEISTIDMKEHVAHWHLAHSYVRGKFRSTRDSAPIVLAKTCHDLDLMGWIVARPALRVASFGSLSHFRAEQAPEGAPQRCTDGCPAQTSCVHDAVRFYLGPDDDLARIWPWADLGSDASRDARRRALETGPYGRCVYRCDNDVADHQVLAIEFEGGVLGTFTLQGLATHERRTIRISGTQGELRGVFQEGLIEVTRHGSLATEQHRIEVSLAGHSGGDEGLLHHFTEVVQRGRPGDVRASGRVSLESHLLGFAAEQSTASRLRRQHGGLSCRTLPPHQRRMKPAPAGRRVQALLGSDSAVELGPLAVGPALWPACGPSRRALPRPDRSWYSSHRPALSPQACRLS